MMDKQQIDKIVDNFIGDITTEMKQEFVSLYIFGSYALGKISMDRPDLDFIIVLKECTGDSYYKIGKFFQKFADKQPVSVRLEFRPFRFIYKNLKQPILVLNPLVISEKELQQSGIISNKIFTKSLKDTAKLMVGKDVLKEIKVGKITRKDLAYSFSDVLFFTVPLARAPVQYTDKDTEAFLNEAFTCAKMIMYLGVEVAMTDKELSEDQHIQLIQNKERMPKFYEERYGKEWGKKISSILDVRENYNKYLNDLDKAREMFNVALELGEIIKQRIFAP